MSTNFEIRQQESCRQFMLRTITMIRDVNSVFLHDHSARNSTTTQVQCRKPVFVFTFSQISKNVTFWRFLSDVSKSRKKSLTTVYSSILRSVIIVIRVSYLSVNLVYLGTYRTLTYFLVNVNTASAFLSKMFDAGLWCCWLTGTDFRGNCGTIKWSLKLHVHFSRFSTFTFKIRRMTFLRFYELLHTFSRTLPQTYVSPIRHPATSRIRIVLLYL